jgi:glutaredoxin-related protein
MKNEFEHINNFLKDEIGDLRVDPGKPVRNRLERKLSYLNFFKYRWNRLNIYYVSVAVILSLYFFINFNHQNVMKNYEHINVKDSTTMETNKKEFIQSPDSSSILHHTNNNDTVGHKILLTDKEQTENKKTKNTYALNHEDSSHHHTNLKIKGQKLNAIRRKKDTVKIVINDTVYKRVKVQVVDTIK